MYIDSYQLIGCNRWYNCHLYNQPNYDKLDTITLKSTQSDVAEWDSLRHLSLIVKIEEEFDLDFDPIEIGDMTSVASICAYIKQNI